MASTFTNGIATLSDEFAGMTIAEVFADETLSTVLSLQGDETATVNGRTVDRNYVVVDGVTVRFARTGGAKGSR